MIPINFFPIMRSHFLARCLWKADRKLESQSCQKSGLIDSSINRLSYPGGGNLFALIIASIQKFMVI
jgi:hypothetical protein